MKSRVDHLVHECNGRWVVAEWDDARDQYVGDSATGARAVGSAYRYTVARTLAGLVSLGVSTYATRAAALAAARRGEGEPPEQHFRDTRGFQELREFSTGRERLRCMHDGGGIYRVHVLDKKGQAYIYSATVSVPAKSSCRKIYQAWLEAVRP